MRVRNDPAESVSPWRSLSRAAVVVAAAAALLLAPARPAAAHAVLSGSDPVNGASLSRVPAVVVLRFTENLVAGASSAQLVDGAGRPVAGAHLVAGSGRELTVRLPRLAAGSYAVVWRVSGVGDGHPTEGVLVFTV
jgi:methionine-rich copper-binding protein CopC